MKKLTSVTKHYLLDFSFRLAVFLFIGAVYLLAPQRLDFTRPGLPSLPLLLLWIAVLCSMLIQLNPNSRLTTGCLKQYPSRFDPVPNYDQAQLDQAVRVQNRGAAKVAALWLGVNLIIGALYQRGLLRVSTLVLLCAFYYLCDLICVLFYCPFQMFLMHNRCCVNCRIFAWGSWMMAAPLMCVVHWYAQTLVWAGVVVLLCWEIRLHRHPERFWMGSNRNLQCTHCQEQLCRYKLARPHPSQETKHDQASA